MGKGKGMVIYNDGYRMKSIMFYNREVLFLSNIWYDYKSKYLELKNVKYHLQEIR